MARARPQSVYRYQAHTVLDGTGRCGGPPDRLAPYDAELSELPCAICLGWYPFTALHEDHAPQRKGQSNLGAPRIVVLTCENCNKGAGKTYEGIVKNENDALIEVPKGHCRVHERYGTTPQGMLVPRDIAARQLTDLKTAYLVGFATLGDRWAASPRLDRLRGVLRGKTGLMFASTDFDIICGCSGLRLPQFKLLQIRTPVPAILVTGAHAAVLLPAHRSPPNIAGTLETDLGGGLFKLDGVMGWHTDWARDFNSSRTVEQVWNNVHTGTLFHVDRCSTASHHSGYALTAAALDQRLQPATRVR